MPEQFYWRHARESLLTDSAIRMFQLLAAHEGDIFDDVKETIDSDYRVAVGTSADSRHGGIIQSQIQVFREAGWSTIDSDGRVTITPAGKQALVLLASTPDFLKAGPYFLVELLARLQLNNPARPGVSKNPEYDAQLKECTVFPYWTLFKIMRSCENYITSDELKRFVFQIKKHEDIELAIEQIKSFRQAVKKGKSETELNEVYPAPLVGTAGETKYIMGRLGTQVGGTPPVVEKPDNTTWELNRYFIPLIDKVLANEPIYKDYLSEESWMHKYGMPVDLASYVSENASPSIENSEPLVAEIDDGDPYLNEVREILSSGGAGVLFSGPPGTGKTWYARQIAIKLVDGDPHRVNFVQFHPSMAYDDFVEGYVPTSGQSNTSFEVKKKMLLRLCDKAKEVSPKICVLVIDEINRGDTSRIFGELLTYIEPSYRDTIFTVAYSGTQTSIPKNLFIIGTFNPYDKSVVELDDAMDRRFERLSFDPSADRLAALLQKHGVSTTLIEGTVKYFIELNKLSRHGIGHTLFMTVSDDASLRRLWNRKLRFILEKAFRFDPESRKLALDGYISLFSDKNNARDLTCG